MYKYTLVTGSSLPDTELYFMNARFLMLLIIESAKQIRYYENLHVA